MRALTLALSDDLVALLVITIIYTRRLSAVPLATAIAMFAVLAALRRAPNVWRSRAVGFLGVGIWVALYEAGTDAVITGLAVGLVTSAHLPHRTALGRAVERVRRFREQPTPKLARTVRRTVAAAISPNDRLQHLFHRWTSFVIVPLFALANAGIQLNGHLLRQGVSSPITLGIVVAYVIGKPLGITASAALALRIGIGRRALSTPVIAGAGIVAGIGFTSSLLIASVALHGQQLQQAKLGILATVMLASVGGWVAFRLIARLPPSVRARQLAGTTDDIVDLADDVDAERDHIRGAADAPVTLIEYGDYECLYCGQAEAVVRELLLSFGEDLRYVWRHLPLTDVHPHAQIGAEASEAAAVQGAFWGMHELLLAHQDQLTLQDLMRYARQLGLDADRLRDDLGRHAYSARVAEDVASADASGVVGTPSFFVNGRRLHGAYDLVTLSSSVRAARSRAAASLASGARLARQKTGVTSDPRPEPGPPAA